MTPNPKVQGHRSTITLPRFGRSVRFQARFDGAAQSLELGAREVLVVEQADHELLGAPAEEAVDEIAHVKLSRLRGGNDGAVNVGSTARRMRIVTHVSLLLEDAKEGQC